MTIKEIEEKKTFARAIAEGCLVLALIVIYIAVGYWAKSFLIGLAVMTAVGCLTITIVGAVRSAQLALKKDILELRKEMEQHRG